MPSRIDDVMAKIARAFVALLLIFSCIEIWATWVHPAAMSQKNPFSNAVWCLWVALWSICLRLPYNPFARWCLGLSAGFLFTSTFGGLLLMIFAIRSIPSNSNFLFAFMLFAFALLAISLLGFASMLWTAIRPPRVNPDEAHLEIKTVGGSNYVFPT
jgi:hypothetical protein